MVVNAIMTSTMVDAEGITSWMARNHRGLTVPWFGRGTTGFVGAASCPHDIMFDRYATVPLHDTMAVLFYLPH